MRKLSKKGKVYAVAASIALVAASGGAAFAYWSTTGSGSGTAATGTSVPVTVNQTSAVAGLAPGSGPQALSGTFTNGNSSPVYVATVTASIASVTKNGAVAVGCDATDFTLTGATVGHEVNTGDSWSGAAIAFFDKPLVNQEACKGVTVNLTYTSN